MKGAGDVAEETGTHRTRHEESLKLERSLANYLEYSAITKAATAVSLGTAWLRLVL